MKVNIEFFIASATIISIKVIDLRRMQDSVNIVGGWNPHYCWIFPCHLWYSVQVWSALMGVECFCRFKVL